MLTVGSRVRAVSSRRATLAGIVFVGALLRFGNLGSQSYWFDEFQTVGLCRHSFGGMYAAYLLSDEGTPPLYYVLVWAWTKLFGTSEVGTRSLSALLGVATLVVVYAAARDLAGSARVGLAAAGLAAVSPLLVWYSQEARSYALFIFLVTLGFRFFVRALEDRRARTIACWGVSSAFALAAHYFAFFAIAGEGLWLLPRFPDSAGRWRPSDCRLC